MRDLARSVLEPGQVLVVLDREAAQTLTAKPMSHTPNCAGPGFDCDCGAVDEGRARMKRGRAAIRAALDRDPDELEARVARAIREVEVGDDEYLSDAQARVALAALSVPPERGEGQ